MQKYFQSFAGIQRYAAAFGFGALLTLALPPVGMFFIPLLCVPCFIWLAQSCHSKRQSFLTGWAFGAGYFILGLYWVSFALFVDIGQWGWVLPFSAVVAPAIVALYYGFIPLVVYRYKDRPTPHVLLFVAAWAGIEFLRGHLFTGFPWNLLGYTWNYVLPVMQANAFIGIYGLTFLTLLWAAVPVIIKDKRLAVFCIVSFAAVFAGGMARLSLHPTLPLGSHTIRIVQPNIPQDQKWNSDEEWRNFQHLLDLTKLPSTLDQPITFVVWPETAVTADLKQFPEIARYIAASLPDKSMALLGSLRTVESLNAPTQFFNSVTALNKQAEIVATYDKHHLVPFGEYIPYRNYLNVTPIAAGISGIGDFNRGRGVSTLDLKGLPRPSPLICYEAIFPTQVASVSDRPEWLLNVTNDAWYGKTAGPHQHFETVRVRAVEEGLPLVRAANTGISAVIDPVGRIVVMKSLQTEGILDSVLPAPLPPTFYARYGDAFYFLLLILAVIFALTSCPKRPDPK
jgi:apolipoprotein N-acyltransferase